MDARDLQSRARQAVSREGLSQAQVAKHLELHRSTVSRALRNAGLKHAAVQARIVSLLEGVPVERRSVYEGRDVRHEWVVHV